MICEQTIPCLYVEAAVDERFRRSFNDGFTSGGNNASPSPLVTTHDPYLCLKLRPCAFSENPLPKCSYWSSEYCFRSADLSCKSSLCRAWQLKQITCWVNCDSVIHSNSSQAAVHVNRLFHVYNACMRGLD